MPSRSTSTSKLTGTSGSTGPTKVIASERTGRSCGTFARVAGVLHPDPPLKPGVHALASVARGAQVDPSAEISANVCIADGVRIGARCFIGPGSVLEPRAVIGDDTKLVARAFIGHDVKLGMRCIVQPGAVVGAWATCVPCVVPEGAVPEGAVLTGCAAAPSLEEVHQLLSRPKARAPRASTRASEIIAIRLLVRAGLLFIVVTTPAVARSGRDLEDPEAPGSGWAADRPAARAFPNPCAHASACARCR